MVISLNILFAIVGIAIATVPIIIAMRMMSLDQRGRKELLEATAPSVSQQIGSCPHCHEVLEWLVPPPGSSVAIA